MTTPEELSDIEPPLPEPADSPRTGPPTRTGPRTWLVALIGVLAIAAVAGAIWTGLAVRGTQHDNAADRDALAAGRTAATAFTSYDYKQLDRDLDHVAAMSTGTFKKQFTDALGALTAAIKKAKGVSVGTVTYVGLQSRKDGNAVVIAAVDAAITNSSTPTASTRRYRLQISLDDASGAWLISAIKPVT